MEYFHEKNFFEHVGFESFFWRNSVKTARQQKSKHTSVSELHTSTGIQTNYQLFHLKKPNKNKLFQTTNFFFFKFFLHTNFPTATLQKSTNSQETNIPTSAKLC